MKAKHESFFEVVDGYISRFIPKNLDASNLHAKMIDQLERSLIGQTLKATNYNQSKSALILGLHRATLRKKIKDLNINRDAKA
jgi:two-component system nitrogen regulation response regulator GlnG